jgi:hypothetical protein
MIELPPMQCRRHIEAKIHEFLTVSIFITLAFLTGCSSPTKEPKKDIKNGLDQLQFESTMTAQKMKALDHCVRETVGPDWRYQPYEKSGNGYSASWCTGTGTRFGSRPDCLIVDDSAQRRDQNIIRLGTSFYTFPEVFGLSVSALWVPPETGWGAKFSFHEDGKRIPNSGFLLYFYFYHKPSGLPYASVHLGDSYSYNFDLTGVRIQSEEKDTRKDLSLYLASSQAMRDRTLNKFAELSKKVEETIESHQARKCEYGPPQSGGIPPICTPRPLTEAEEQKALSTARSFFAKQEKLVQRQHKEMYVALRKAFPFDRCWH